MTRIIRQINIIVLLAIFYLVLTGNIELISSYYFGIAIGTIFLVNMLPIIVKIYKNYIKPTETIRPIRWYDPSNSDTEVEDSDDSDVTVVGESDDSDENTF